MGLGGRQCILISSSYFVNELELELILIKLTREVPLAQNDGVCGKGGGGKGGGGAGGVGVGG
jgi:hypothetical protein